MRNNYITLPIFHHTPETSKANSLELYWKLEDTEVREIIFFNINAISKLIEFGKETNYTQIFANGDEFTSPLSIEEVLRIITNNEGSNIQSTIPAT